MKKWILTVLSLWLLFCLPGKASALEESLELGKTVTAKAGESFLLRVSNDCTVAIYNVSDIEGARIGVYDSNGIAADGVDQVLLEAKAGVPYRVKFFAGLTYMVEKAAKPEGMRLDHTSYTGYPNDRIVTKFHPQPENALFLISRVTVEDPEVAEIVRVGTRDMEMLLKKTGQTTVTLNFENGFVLQIRVSVNPWQEFSVGQTLTLEGQRTWQYCFYPEKTGIYIFERQGNDWGVTGMEAFTAEGTRLCYSNQRKIAFAAQAGEEIWVHFTVEGMGQYIVSTREAPLADLYELNFYEQKIYLGDPQLPNLSQTDISGLRIVDWEYEDPAAFRAYGDGFIPLMAGDYTVTAVFEHGERLTKTLTVRTPQSYEDYQIHGQQEDRIAFTPETSGEYTIVGPIELILCDGIVQQYTQVGYTEKGAAVVYKLDAGKTYLVIPEENGDSDIIIEPLEQGEYVLTGRREIHLGDTLSVCVQTKGFMTGAFPNWQWESSDPVVLSFAESYYRDETEISAEWKTGKPGKAVITVTSDQGHTLQTEVEVYTNAIRHGLRLVEEGADLKLKCGNKKDLQVVLKGDPDDFCGITIVSEGYYGSDAYSPYLSKDGLAVSPGEEGSGEFAVTIPGWCLPDKPGVYYVCYEGLEPEPVSKLMILEFDSHFLTWALAVGVTLLLAGAGVFWLRRRKPKQKGREK